VTRNWRRNLSNIPRLVPALVMRDPWFRYAAIAAGLALLFLVGQFAQDWAGPPVVPRPASAAATGLIKNGSTPIPAEIPAIAPGRPLNGITVDPAPGDAFGKLPKGTKQP
jgi:hypothetical protein